MSSVRDQVIVNVASSYLELAKVRRELDLLHCERDSAQKILDYTQQRTQAGYELPIEVTKAQLTSARVDQRLAQLEDADESISRWLRNQLGAQRPTSLLKFPPKIFLRPLIRPSTISLLKRSKTISRTQAGRVPAGGQHPAQLRGEHGNCSMPSRSLASTASSPNTTITREFFNKFETQQFHRRHRG